MKELVKRGWIEFSSNVDVLEQRISDFLFVDSLDDHSVVMPAAARMSTDYLAFNSSQWAWLCRAHHVAKAVPVEETFKPDSETDLMTELRPLFENAEDVRNVPRLLGSFGIRFLVIEHLNKTRIDGACLWLNDSSPVIALSTRYDRIDYFWFTLLHELKHVYSRDGLEEVWL